MNLNDYKNMLYKAPFAIASFKIVKKNNNINYECVNFNNRFQKIIGLDKPDILNKTIFHILLKINKNTKSWIDHFDKVSSDGVTRDFVHYLNNSSEYYKVNIIKNSEDLLTIFLIEYSLKESEKPEALDQIKKDYEKEFKFTMKLLDNIGQGITIVDKNARFRYVNPTYARLLGVDELELIGRDPRDYSIIKDNNVLTEQFNLRKDGKVSSYESTLVNKDGERIPVLITGVPIFQEGELNVIVSVITNISEIKNAKEKLDYQINFQELIAEISTDFININISNYDEKINNLIKEIGLFFKVDRSYLMLFSEDKKYISVTHEWCSSDKIAQISNVQNYPIFKMKWLSNIINKNEIVYIEEVNKLPEIAEVEKKEFLSQGIKSLINLPIYNEEKLLGIFGFDSINKKRKWIKEEINMIKILSNIIINANKNIDKEKKIDFSTKKIIQANEAKSRFLAFISHEIKNPLNATLAYINMVNKNILDEKQALYFKRAEESAESIFDIINDLLDISKIEAGKLDLNPFKTSILDLSENCLNIINPLIDTKNIKLSLNLTNDIPKYIFADPVRLKQIIVNLLTNSAKFTKKGEIELNINFSQIDDNKGRFYFSVKDTGIGISKEEKKNLFKAFSQGDITIYKEYGGSGLGLFISNKLLKLMNSKIEFKSEKNKGSIFYFPLDLEYYNQ